MHALARTNALAALLIGAGALGRPAAAAETVIPGTPAFAQCRGSFERGLCVYDGAQYVPLGGIDRARGQFDPYVATEYVARQNGMKCDGVTDDTAALAAILAKIQASATRGVIRISGTCLLLGAIAPVTDGGVHPRQAPIRITGDGHDFDSQLYSGFHRGGATLDLRYSGADGLHPAKIDTRGAGILQIDNINIKGGEAGDDFPILQTTNTTLDIDAIHIYGNPRCYRNGFYENKPACKQDAIVLGGTTDDMSKLAGPDADSGFQGYGTTIRNVKFSRVRRAITFNSAANGSHIVNPTIDYTNGSADALGAPFVFTGKGNGATGNVFTAGIVEMIGYAYGFAFIGEKQSAQNSILGTGLYDSGTLSVSGVYYGVGHNYNVFAPSAIPPRPHLQTGVAGPYAGRNTYIPTHPTDLMIIPGGIDVGLTDASFFRAGVTVTGSQGLTTGTLFGGTAPGSGLTINSTGSSAPAGDFIAGNVGGKRNFTITADRFEWAQSVAVAMPARVYSAALPTSPPNGVAYGTRCTDTAGQDYTRTSAGPCVPPGAFASYTPTASAPGGTIAYSASGSYQIEGKRVFGTFNVAISNANGASGTLTVSLPTGVRGYTASTGIDLNTTRNLNVRIPGGGNQALVVLDGGATIVASGSNIVIPFAYEMP